MAPGKTASKKTGACNYILSSLKTVLFFCGTFQFFWVLVVRHHTSYYTFKYVVLGSRSWENCCQNIGSGNVILSFFENLLFFFGLIVCSSTL